MTRPDYRGWLTDEDVARIVAAMETSHRCSSFNEEERQIIHDMATGGKLVKKTIIYVIVAVVLYAILAKSVLIKVGQVIGLIK